MVIGKVSLPSYPRKLPFFTGFYGIYDSKTSCFGGKETALYDERKAFYDTKTTCFTLKSIIAFMPSPFDKGIEPRGNRDSDGIV